jgi:hypothetical protein
MNRGSRRRTGRRYPLGGPSTAFRLAFVPLLIPLLLPAAERPVRPAVFVLHTVEGRPVTGPLEQLATDWSVALGGRDGGRAKGADVVSLRRADATLPSIPAEPQAVLSNGDRIPGHVRDLARERLRLRPAWEGAAEMSLPVSVLSVLWLEERVGPDSAALLRDLPGERRPRDLVLLRNGDRIEGTLTAINGASLHVEVEKKDVTVERDRATAVAFSTDLARPLRPRGVFGRLVLRNGCRLSLASAHTDGGLLVAKAVFGETVRVDLDQVAALDLLQGRAVYLSALKPRRETHTPFLGVRWPYLVDRNAGGGELRLGGSTYDRGLGMRARTGITYDLGAGYRRFEAVVGLDDRSGRSGRSGSARVRVLVDGEPRDLGFDGELARRDKPRSLRVGVTGAQELTLEVDFGRPGDAPVDWADARLIK